MAEPSGHDDTDSGAEGENVLEENVTAGSLTHAGGDGIVNPATATQGMLTMLENLHGVVFSDDEDGEELEGDYEEDEDDDEDVDAAEDDEDEDDLDSQEAGTRSSGRGCTHYR
eukprot:102346-Rhodomonas_salina.1